MRTLLNIILLLCLAGGAAHAEGALSVNVLDHVRQGDETSLLLFIDDEAADDPARPGADSWHPPPQACVDGGAMQDANESRGGCFAFSITEGDQKLPSHRSRILFSGVSGSYVLLVYRTHSRDASTTRVHIDVENFGYHNGHDTDQLHTIGRDAGTLDARHPLRRLYAILDGQLNEDYQRIIGDLGTRSQDIAGLRESQRNWLKITDTNCGARAAGDPGWEEDYLRCRLRFIERRLAEFTHIASKLDIPFRDDPD